MLARICIIPPLLALAAFCFYGILATYEPGDFAVYRIAYAAGLTLCLVGCVATWVLTGKPKA